MRHIMYSQSSSSSVAHLMFICPTAEKAYSSPQCQTIFPSQYTIHYDTSHLSLRTSESPGISSSERKHTPLNKAGCTPKQKCHMWEIIQHELQVSCSETCTNNKQGKRNNFRIKTNSLENRQTIFATNTISIKQTICTVSVDVFWNGPISELV